MFGIFTERNKAIIGHIGKKGTKRMERPAVKYYFVLYRCEDLLKPNLTLKPLQKIIEGQHPLAWQLEWNKRFQTQLGEECTVLSWQEISREEYESFRNEIG